MHDARPAHWKVAILASVSSFAGLCVSMRYLYVERAGPTLCIRRRALCASGFLCMHKNVHRARRMNEHARRTPNMRRARCSSARHTRSTHGAHTEHTRSTHGAHTEHTHGAHTEHTRSTHGAHTEHTRSTHGAHTEHARSTHGAHTEHTRSTHGAHTEHTLGIRCMFFGWGLAHT